MTKGQFIFVYGFVLQGLGTTKFTNFIGWNWCWKQSTFSNLDRHLDWSCSERVAHWNAKSFATFIWRYLFMEVPRSLMRQKSKEDKQTFAELNSAHQHSETKCQVVQTSYIKLFLLAPCNKHLVKILSYSWPPTQLIRAKQWAQASYCWLVHWNWILERIFKTEYWHGRFLKRKYLPSHGSQTRSRKERRKHLLESLVSLHSSLMYQVKR